MRSYRGFVMLYGSIDLEEIQLRKSILLFYWGNPSHAKILSFCLHLPIIYQNFMASASEGLPIFLTKPEIPLFLLLS